MSDIPISSFIFVDRRKTGRGKSLPNREKLLRRVKESIRAAKPEDIDAGGVKGGAQSASKQLANPVKIARDALAEPTFRYASHSGEYEVVLPGNDKWLKGDEFPMDGEGEGGGGGSGPGEDGEDDFVVNISRSEFFDVFFEDCALPDLEQTTEKELPEAVNKPAGFQKEGTPGQLSVIRSYRNSLGRRRALNGETYAEIERLEAEVEAYNNGTHEQCAYLDLTEIGSIIYDLQVKIAELKATIDAKSGAAFEKVDLRYRKTEKVMVKSADAVLIMAMDVSGSMDEERKRLGRKYFAMQYAFIKRKYPNTDLVFIWHTDHAEECDEETFFTTRMNGGTVISEAIVLAHQIIKERYDATQTNIYFSYAGDGDNFSYDNSKVIDAFENGFLGKLRHAVYIQVGEEMGSSWAGQSGQALFWNTMQSIANSTKKMHVVKVHNEGEVFTAFKKVYAKKPSKKA